MSLPTVKMNWKQRMAYNLPAAILIRSLPFPFPFRPVLFVHKDMT